MKKLLFLWLLLLLFLSGLAQSKPDSAVLHAPDIFKAEFVTTKGNFTLEIIREWSHQGADRIFQLITSNYFNDNCVFRVQPGYVIQFGINDKKAVNRFWDTRSIEDEPVKASNVKGTIAFAHGGPKTRTTQVFINLSDNLKLDTIVYQGIKGFPPVGRVIKGMEVVESFFGGYGFDPAEFQDSIMFQGNAFLKKKFPKLDYILEVKLAE